LWVKRPISTLEEMKRALQSTTDPAADRAPTGQSPRDGGAKYQDVANRLLGRIEDSEWLPGDRLPSETELAQIYRASVGTIQKALQCLVEDGVLVRRHGSGTFVAVGNVRDEQVRHFRFLSEDEQSILPISIEMISVDRTHEQGPWARFLGREDSYLCVTRRISINREFDIVAETLLSVSRFGAIATLEPVELRHVRDLLAERFHRPTLRVEQTVTVQTLPPRACRHIGAPLGTIGIVWVIRGRTYRDAPLSWQRAFVPPSDHPLLFTAWMQ
jgi:GntR family transcriptional regulator